MWLNYIKISDIQRAKMEEKYKFHFLDGPSDAKKMEIKTVLVYEPLTNGEYFDTTTDFDYKMDTISVENLKKIGL